MNGYDLTTAAEIARHAGVTERTFFRHFADKREVLFGSEPVLLRLLTKAMHDAPRDPWAALLHVFQATEAFFVENRELIVERGAIIAMAPQLQERELAKVKALTLALADGLRERGTPSETAKLAAQVGVATFTAAVSSWLEDSGASLGACLVTTFSATRILTASDSS